MKNMIMFEKMVRRLSKEAEKLKSNRQKLTAFVKNKIKPLISFI